MPVAPKVSVIVPVFNAVEKLVPSIQSLLNQTLRDIEIIIVNDASTDDSGAVINQLANSNPNIRPVHSPDNKGAHEARLAGLKLSTAPWIGFLDADDYARPKMFETMLSAAERHDVDIVVCGSDRVTEQRKVIAPKLRFPRSEKVTGDIFERFCAFEFGTGMLVNKLFRRSVIAPWFDLHFPWRQNANEDLLLNIGCFYNAKSICLLREKLYEYVLNDRSYTSKISKHAAYTETFRAYVVAVICYQHLGTQPLLNIIEMYRKQISWGSYQLPSIAELREFNKQLEEASVLLSKENSFALSAIVTRRAEHIVGVRVALRSLYSYLVNKLKSIFLC